MMINLLIVFMLINLYSLPNENKTKIKALYGFSKSLSLFQGKSNQKIVKVLKSWDVNAIFGGIEDKKFVSVLHDSGIKIFVEIGFFVGERYWERYPKSRPITNSGDLLPKEEWYAGVNPVIEEIQKEKFSKIKELITKSNIDGIWLDFIRWPCYWESSNPKLLQTSFDELTVNKFLKDTQIIIQNQIKDPIERNQWILENHLSEWTDWKCDQITNIVKQVREIVMDSPRKILIGLFGVPWRIIDFDGAIMKIIGQDYKALAKYVDVFSPMVYHVMCGKDVKWIGEITRWVHQQTIKPVLPIIQSMNIPNTLSTHEFSRAIRNGIEAEGSCGIIVFNIKGLSDEKIKVMQKFFRSTGFNSGG